MLMTEMQAYLAALATQVARLESILRRFVRPEDAELSDRDLALAVFARYQRYLADEPGDPNA